MKLRNSLSKGIILVLLAAVALSGCGDSSTASSAAPAQTKEAAAETKAETKAESKKVPETKAAEKETSSDSSYDKYQKISIGQSLDDIEGILGSDETVSSSSEAAGIKTEIYAWNIDLAAITVTLTDGKVSGKSQVGITAPDAVKIDTDKFNAIDTGMTYDDVVKAVGGPGTPESYVEIAGSVEEGYVWEGDSLGSSATIMFSDGKVSNKSQVGL